ncbi:MAG: hypothetical protein Q7T83_11010, partial [Thermodesulfovibrionales bacterium]|nr:hypothetical protein [Thermodesulfovibrionales bacterium]
GDRRTDVVISYIESVGDGRKFIEKAKALSKKKPLLILKAGKGESGQAAAFSHTGRLAGRYEVFHSILKQFGIQEAEDFDVLMDATKALAYQGQGSRVSPQASRRGDKGQERVGNRVLIITNGGGSGVLAADECMKQGLEVAKLPEDKIEKLKNIFPHFYGINNPVDLTAQVKDEDYTLALNELKDAYDGFVIIALPNVNGITMKLADIMKAAKKDISKPVVFYVSDGETSKKLIKGLEKAKVPVYPSPERAVRAIRALLTHT